MFIRAGVWHLFILIPLIMRYLQNIHEKKFSTHEIPTRKKFGPTKYPRDQIWAHEIPTRKNFGRTEYPREKISNA